MCERSREYRKEMCKHNNFGWAFKHVMPYSVQYPIAVNELNRCIQMFVRLVAEEEEIRNNRNKKAVKKTNEDVIEIEVEEVEDDEDSDDENDEDYERLKHMVDNLKESLAMTFLSNPNIDAKQCWQSILMVIIISSI